MCVQRFDDSLNSAIHITYRISLRSSSMPEPRDPLLKVLKLIYHRSDVTDRLSLGGPWRALIHRGRRGARGPHGPPKQQKVGTHRVEVRAQGTLSR